MILTCAGEIKKYFPKLRHNSKIQIEFNKEIALISLDLDQRSLINNHPYFEKGEKRHGVLLCDWSRKDPGPDLKLFPWPARVKKSYRLPGLQPGYFAKFVVEEVSAEGYAKPTPARVAIQRYLFDRRNLDKLLAS